LKLIEDIKFKLGEYFLDKSPVNNRRVKVNNFAQSTRIGIIYKEQDESFFILVKQYVKYLKEEHGIRNIIAMAYLPEKHVPHYHHHKLEFDFFTVAELNWKMKPEGIHIENFIANDFDILIDLTLDAISPLVYVLAKSRAHFKVGAFHTEKDELLDLMIDMDGKSTFDQYLKKINHFLTTLNKKHAYAI
jgi:hypothetical protein